MKLPRNLYIVLVAVVSLFFFYLVYTPDIFATDYNIKNSDPNIIEPPEPKLTMMTEPKISEPVEPIQESHNLQENFEPTPSIPLQCNGKVFYTPLPLTNLLNQSQKLLWSLNLNN